MGTATKEPVYIFLHKNFQIYINVTNHLPIKMFNFVF